MNLLENILLALAGLKSNKMRSMLTMLGIIIGIGSVIAIVNVSSALTNSINEAMASMGTSRINVNLREINATNVRRGPGSSVDIDEEDRISDEMVTNLEETFSNQIEAISITQSVSSGTAQDGRLYANVSVTGASPGVESANSIEMTEGRFISSRDANKNTCVVSSHLVDKIFGGESPLGEEVKVYTTDDIRTYTVVGVYEYEQGDTVTNVSYDDISTTLYIPVSTAIQIKGNGGGYTSFMVNAYSDVDTTVLAEKIAGFFERYYQNNKKYEVSANAMTSMINRQADMMNTLTIAAAVIASISLLVGGIGVMNIMLVSVTERTREIGTRKALGARSSAIRIQFIVESIIICLIGGILGVGLGIGLGALGASLLGASATMSVPVILIAVGFSMGIGVFFGYYPANKAAKMDPIEALRYE